MKKLYTILSTFSLALGISGTASAQLANGSTAPDLNLTDLNGNTYNLYSILNSGKSVVIDVSAAWCGPCWAYHGTGILDSIVTVYGPSGTNEMMAFFIEGESANTTAQLYGPATGGSAATQTQGDWVTGSQYPICDDAAAADALQIGFFPTLYLICPSKKVWHISPSAVGLLYATQLHEAGLACANPVDALMDSYTGETSSCGSLDLKVKIQNKGANPLTSATITASVGGNVVATNNWTGNLAQFQEATVTVGNTTLTADANVVFNITATSDVVNTNNAITQSVFKAPVVSTNKFTVKVSTDRYGSEVTWKLRKSNNAVVLSGGPYTDQSSAGTYPQAEKNYVLPVGAVECYKFEIADSYGDGMCCSYGEGSYEVLDGNDNTVLTGTGQYGDVESKRIDATSTSQTSIDEVINSGSFNVYPNPTTGLTSISFDAKNSTDVRVEVSTIAGQVMLSDVKSVSTGNYFMPLDLSNMANGIYFVKIATAEGSLVSKITLNK